jgi:hypothetical protein
VPIVFKDREVGTSKMSKTIIVEALQVVLQLRWEEMRGRGPAGIISAAAAGPTAAGPTAAANSPHAARPDDRPSG